MQSIGAYRVLLISCLSHHRRPSRGKGGCRKKKTRWCKIHMLSREVCHFMQVCHDKGGVIGQFDSAARKIAEVLIIFCCTAPSHDRRGTEEQVADSKNSVFFQPFHEKMPPRWAVFAPKHSLCGSLSTVKIQTVCGIPAFKAGVSFPTALLW